MKRVALHTLGCKLNYVETASIGQQFVKYGYKIVHNFEEADIVIINTCTVTENADRECRQIIRRAIRKSPQASIIVTGCYSQLQSENIAKIKGVDLVLGNSEKKNILEYINDFKKGSITEIFVSCDESISPASSIGYEERTRAFIKIQDGCDFTCSYCIVPLARGKSRSARIEEVVQLTQDAAENGYKEIVLTGVNIGCYRDDEGADLKKLLTSITKVDGIERIRISSIEPNLLSDELLNLWMNNEKICNHWHIPLQSGSDNILKKMNRKYNKKVFAECVKKIKNKIPAAGIGIDLIVGFPGETDELFQETFDFINEMPISYIHVFPYSERPNTRAINYFPKVSYSNKTNRCKKLNDLSLEKRKTFNSCFLNKIVSVLFESKNNLGVASGLTEEYIRVYAKTEKNIANNIMNAEIKEASADSCIGEITSRSLSN